MRKALAAAMLAALNCAGAVSAAPAAPAVASAPAAPAAPAAASLPIAPVPLASDLQRDGHLAARAAMPLVLFFSLPDCPYCHTVRHNYLAPLLRGPEAAGGEYVIREIEVGGKRAATGLDGGATTHAALARRYAVSFAPTVLFVGPSGEALAPPLLGGDTSGMYGAYLDARLAAARQAAKLLVLPLRRTAASAGTHTTPPTATANQGNPP